MATALSFPTITGVTGAPYMPDLSEAANIQAALKYLYYGSTGVASNSDGLYGALQRLYVGNPTLAGTVTVANMTVNGALIVNGTTTTINSNTLAVDDKNIELGSVASGVVSATGTIGTVSGTGPYTATITNFANPNAGVSLIVGETITATAGTGSLGSGVVTVTSIPSSTSITVSSTLTMTAGTITNITGGGASDSSANGGGITLKGTSDKTIIWDSTNSNWTTSENLNLATGKTLKINNVDIASGTGAQLVLGANAATSIDIGALGGTATIKNTTVSLTNATVLNINGASPSIATSSTGTASVFNTNALTVNVGQAATTLSLGATTGTGSIRNATVTFPNATAMTLGAASPTITFGTGPTLTTASGTLALFNTGATTVNAFGAATTIGLGNASGTTTIAGNLTLSTSGATLTLPTTSGTTPPLKMTSGTLIGTPAAGAAEFDGKVFYSTPNATTGRGISPSTHYYILPSDRSLASSTSAQSVFNVGLPLASGTVYEFEMIVQFDYIPTATTITVTDLFAYTGTLNYGTATYQFSSNTTSLGTSSAVNQKFTTTITSGSSIVSASGSAQYIIYTKRGTFSTSTSGTLTPQLQMSSTVGLSQAPSIKQGSYIKVTPVGAQSSTISVGAWA